MKQKRCSICRHRKLFIKFSKDKRTADGLTSECNKCRNTTTKRWRKSNPDKVKRYSILWPKKNRKAYLKKKKLYRQRHPERARQQVKNAFSKHKDRYAATKFRRWLHNKYGISEQDYSALLEKQKGSCAICHKSQQCADKTKRRTRLYVDHCHKTGRIRGLLCFKCNVLLGCAGDDATLLRRAIAYLDKSINAQNAG